MSIRRDRIADEFGTPDWGSEFESRPQSPYSHDSGRDMSRDQAMDELDRRLARGELKPLGNRAEITDDWIMDAPGWSEFNGPKPAGATHGERQQLHREYSSQIEEIFSSPGMQRRPEPEKPVTVDGRQLSGAEYAEVLWSEFREAFPDQARDANAVERAAKKLISSGALNPDDRSAFYRRLAAELSSG